MSGAFWTLLTAITVQYAPALLAQSPDRDTLWSGDFFSAYSKPILVTLPPAAYSAYNPGIRSRAGFIALISFSAQPTYSQLFTTNSGSTSAIPERRIRTQSLRFVGEYGFKDNTTFSFQMPINGLQSLGPTDGTLNPQTQSGQLWGLGNTELAVKYRFPLSYRLLSASLRLGLPAKQSSPGSGLATGFHAFHLVSMVHIGTPIGFNQYVFLFGGYGLRSNQYGQLFHGGAAYGYRFRQFGLELASTFFQPFNARDATISSSQQALGLYHPQLSYWTIEAKGDWRFSRFIGANFNISVPVWGCFYPNIPTLEAAAYFQWD